MQLVGLTGGIGSGKSTVARLLAEHGAHIVDADVVAREVVAPGEPALDAVVERFGPAVRTSQGGLDRAAVAAIVFDDPAAREALEAITHPLIAARIAEHVADHLAAERDEPSPRVVVVDHPLLVETGQAAQFPEVVVVLASEDVRVARLVADRGMTEADARARIRSQASDGERRAVATHVVVNDGDLDTLATRVGQIYAALAGPTT